MTSAYSRWAVRTIRATLFVAAALLPVGEAHAFDVRIVQPLRVRPGEQIVFVVQVTRPVGSPDANAFGAFVDPSVDWSVRSTLPFGFLELADGRCNYGFSFDFAPAPNFLGFFGAEALSPGETIVCRVVLGAAPQARLGTYRAALALDTLTVFDVVVQAGPARPIPAASTWWLVALGGSMLLAAAIATPEARCQTGFARKQL